MTTIYVGIDIGGTLSKVTLVSEHLKIPQSISVVLANKSYNLYSESFNDFGQCLGFLHQHLAGYDTVKLGLTGGGTIKYGYPIRENFPKAEISNFIEYDACTKGINFIKETGLKINRWQFTKQDQTTVHSTFGEIALNECDLPLQLVSLGSGVSCHKLGLVNDKFERLKVDDPRTSFDGYLLDGTSLGGGYIFGLIRSLSEQSDPQKIIELIKTNDRYRTIYEELLVNLMQFSISQTIIHHISTVLVTGTLLKLKPIFKEFERAVQLTIQPLPFKRSFVSLGAHEGFLGNLGTIYSFIVEQK